MPRLIQISRQSFLAIICAAIACNQAMAASVSHAEKCVGILARILPGEYHYCVAVNDWQHGRNQSGLEEARYAAQWGDKRAQFELGVDYFDGRHGAVNNHSLGLAWLALAAERNDPHYVSILSSARSQATPEEQQQASSLFSQMREHFGDAVAAPRAERRYHTELSAIREQVWDVIRVKSRDPVDPWSENTVVQIDGLGVVQPMVALKQLQRVGDAYFQGWGGQPAVEP